MRTYLCVSLCVRGERERVGGGGGGRGIIYWFSTPSEMCIGYIRAMREDSNAKTLFHRERSNER